MSVKTFVEFYAPLFVTLVGLGMMTLGPYVAFKHHVVAPIMFSIAFVSAGGFLLLAGTVWLRNLGRSK